MPTFLGQIERLLERAFEVPSQRFFRTRLQPIELARALGRAMVAEGQIGPEGITVPSRYVIELHPAEVARFAPNQQSLERDLATYVVQQAQRRGWACAKAPGVEIASADDVPRGRARISVAPESDAEIAPRSPSSADALDATSILPPRAAQRTDAQPGGARAWLELEDGQRIGLTGGRVRLGRSLDNDVVLDHESVSRQHAEIRRRGDTFLISDLGSTNGTRVNGRPIDELTLLPGAIIHVGAVRMRLHTSP